MTLGDLVRDELAALGPDAALVADVWLVVQALPTHADLALGCEPEQLGAFVGCPRELGRAGGPLPDTRPAQGLIKLFLANIRPLTPENLRIVLRHELMHALGWEEDEIAGQGLGSLGGAACCRS